MWKLQATATINLKIPLLNTDGTQAIGETTNLFTKIVAPDGTAVTSYTEATFTEPNSDGIYNVSFPSTAPIKAFLLEDQANPYSVTLDSSTTDVDPMSVDAWITSKYLWELSTQTSVDLVQSSVDNFVGGVQRIQTSLSSQTIAASGDNWVKVLVLVNDSLGVLFDPADIVDPTPSRLYNGVGATFSDIDDEQVVMYKDNLGTVLDTVSLCHHTPQSNKPQILERDANGLYYFWMNSTAEGDALPVGQLKVLFGLFDITQTVATYSGTSPFLIQDTEPSSHLHILFAINVSATTDINGKLDDIIVDIAEHETSRATMQTRIEGNGFDPAQNSLKNIKDTIG